MKVFFRLFDLHMVHKDENGKQWTKTYYGMNWIAVVLIYFVVRVVTTAYFAMTEKILFAQAYERHPLSFGYAILAVMVIDLVKLFLFIGKKPPEGFKTVNGKLEVSMASLGMSIGGDTTETPNRMTNQNYSQLDETNQTSPSLAELVSLYGRYGDDLEELYQDWLDPNRQNKFEYRANQLFKKRPEDKVKVQELFSNLVKLMMIAGVLYKEDHHFIIANMVSNDIPVYRHCYRKVLEEFLKDYDFTEIYLKDNNREYFLQFPVFICVKNTLHNIVHLEEIQDSFVYYFGPSDENFSKELNKHFESHALWLINNKSLGVIDEDGNRGYLDISAILNCYCVNKPRFDNIYEQIMTNRLPKTRQIGERLYPGATEEDEQIAEYCRDLRDVILTFEKDYGRKVFYEYADTIEKNRKYLVLPCDIPVKGLCPEASEEELRDLLMQIFNSILVTMDCEAYVMPNIDGNSKDFINLPFVCCVENNVMNVLRFKHLVKEVMPQIIQDLPELIRQVKAASPNGDETAK